jgi:hypothetical protein
MNHTPPPFPFRRDHHMQKFMEDDIGNKLHWHTRIIQSRMDPNLLQGLIP